MGKLGHSAVIVQTHQDTEAEITIIVHSRDENLTRTLHEVCAHAVRHAVRSFDHLSEPAAGSGACYRQAS